jgi:hypothetical protein
MNLERRGAASPNSLACVVRRMASRAFVLETGVITLSGPTDLLADDPRIFGTALRYRNFSDMVRCLPRTRNADRTDDAGVTSFYPMKKSFWNFAKMPVCLYAGRCSRPWRLLIPLSSLPPPRLPWQSASQVLHRVPSLHAGLFQRTRGNSLSSASLFSTFGGLPSTIWAAPLASCSSFPSRRMVRICSSAASAITARS